MARISTARGFGTCILHHPVHVARCPQDCIIIRRLSARAPPWWGRQRRWRGRAGLSALRLRPEAAAPRPQNSSRSRRAMDDQVRRLVDKAWARYQSVAPDRRLIIGIAGIPGSGKTTLAQIVARELNGRAARASPEPAPPAPAAFVPMDGFHLTRAALDAMPDPDHAHARRGAAFTFDAPKFLRLVQALRVDSPPGSATILAPSFDHAVKDPKEGDIAVLPTHRIVILEGNYLALDAQVWRDAAALLDELWFVEVDFDVARRRLRERHVRAGIAKDIQEGDRRARENDLVNGEEIISHRLKVDEVIVSREDDGWKHE